MPDPTLTRSSTSYSIELMQAAKAALGLDANATLDDMLKKILRGGTVELSREQWWAYGERFHGK